MADVFISYKREEREAVERLARELRTLGLVVWFDASLDAGEAFSDEIDREARKAKAVLVCWSPSARGSQWVKAEALIGFEERKLAACYVAGPDGFKPPTPFNSIHAEDLRAWLSVPSATHAGWRSILRRIGKLCGRDDIESYGALDAQSGSAIRAWIEQYSASPLFIAVDELSSVRNAEDAERLRLEQEARARRAREEDERLAREESDRITREEVERRTRRQSEKADRLEAARRAHAQREEDNRTARYETSRADRVKRDRMQTDAGRAGRFRWQLVLGGGAVAAIAIAVVMNTGLVQTTPTTQSGSVVGRQAMPVDASSLHAGEQFDDCGGAGWCPRMVVIPAGSFRMGFGGYPVGMRTTYYDRNPIHQVSVPQFAAGVYEVTRAQWAACVADGGCSTGDASPAWGDRPIASVSWRDAIDYVEWLSGEIQQPYRLLSEAEWEYAARANMRDLLWEDASSSICEYAHVFQCNSEAFRTGRFEAFSVGALLPSPFGLYDIFGNVSEWVQDCYADYIDRTPNDGSAKEDCDRAAPRVFRGSNFERSYENEMDPAGGRLHEEPNLRDRTIGLRVARTLN